MTPTYTLHAVTTTLRCQDCGAAADLLLVADICDRDTGDQDQMALCRACADKRGRRA